MGQLTWYYGAHRVPPGSLEDRVVLEQVAAVTLVGVALRDHLIRVRVRVRVRVGVGVEVGVRVRVRVEVKVGVGVGVTVRVITVYAGMQSNELAVHVPLLWQISNA